jgi:2-amino-4-hydroxy-6-hydroxymethyldihydropteridine diphosphokinase
MASIAYIGIGSNLGDKVLQCQRAVQEILKIDRHRLLAQSSLYKSLPLGYTDQDWFVNGVIEIETDLEPLPLLQELKSIEERFGRRQTFRWGPRVIDLDILFYGERKVREALLEIPHPRLHERQFVLIPLAEIAPDFVHPVLGKTIRELLENFSHDQGVEKISGLLRRS